MVTVGPHRLEEAEVKGAIFDVDGTLLDTMPIFYPSWPRTATGEQPRFGLRVSEEDFYRLAGVPLPDMVQRLHRAQKGCEATPAFVKDFIDEKIRLHQEEEAEKGHPPAISCVVALAEDYLRRGIPVAIATSGIKGIVPWFQHRPRLQHLEAAGLKDLVPAECMVFASDVPKGKPDPAIYLEAARRLGVDPTKCRAYEDGESGLQSAVAAGMETVDVTFMEGYPAPEALRQAKEEQIRERTWLLFLQTHLVGIRDHARHFVPITGKSHATYMFVKRKYPGGHVFLREGNHVDGAIYVIHQGSVNFFRAAPGAPKAETSWRNPVMEKGKPLGLLQPTSAGVLAREYRLCAMLPGGVFSSSPAAGSVGAEPFSVVAGAKPGVGGVQWE
eukprot:g32155.t1